MKKFWNFIKNEDTGETELYFEGPISNSTSGRYRASPD